ncbi:MAG: hypothetical protein IJE48_07740 [Clostridia bacterium]|nr:hypothetical protein [Clostridia bacterium]
MAKKKRNTVVNNIDSVNIEIDYDKLAHAIVNANKKTQYDENAEYSSSREWMKFIATCLLYGFSILCLLTSLGLFAVGIKLTFEFNSAEYKPLIEIAISIIGAFFLLLLAAFTFLAAKDLDGEQDKNYVATVFSNTMSMFALIVALIALFKEVG